MSMNWMETIKQYTSHAPNQEDFAAICKLLDEVLCSFSLVEQEQTLKQVRERLVDWPDAACSQRTNGHYGKEELEAPSAVLIKGLYIDLDSPHYCDEDKIIEVVQSPFLTSVQTLYVHSFSVTFAHELLKALAPLTQFQRVQHMELDTVFFGPSSVQGQTHFVEELSMYLPPLQSLSIRRAHLNQGELGPILAHTWFAQLKSLELDVSSYSHGELVSSLAETTSLQQLEHLGLFGPISSKEWSVLCKATHFKSIGSLTLDGSSLCEEKMKRLTNAPISMGLRKLILTRCKINSEAAAVLAQSTILKDLEHFDLSHNDLGEKGRAALLASPFLPVPLKSQFKQRELSDIIASMRDVLHRQPSEEAWSVLCHALDKQSFNLPTPEREALFIYLEQHLELWPTDLREAPEHWTLHDDEHDKLRLAHVASFDTDEGKLEDHFLSGFLECGALYSIQKWTYYGHRDSNLLSLHDISWSFPALRTWSIWFNDIEPDLIQSWSTDASEYDEEDDIPQDFPHLEELHFECCTFFEGSLEALLLLPWFTQLKTLRIVGCSLSKGDIQLIAQSPALSQLFELDLTDSLSLQDEKGLSALRTSSTLAQVTKRGFSS